MRDKQLVFEEDELFKEFLLVHGFKMVAARDHLLLPKSKYLILLQTANKQLFKVLKKWAWKNDVAILYNPEGCDYEIFNNICAFVIDTDLVHKFPFQELLKGKYIKAELEFDLLQSILTDMKTYGNK